MEAGDEWIHYCDDPKTKQFVLVNIKKLKEEKTNNYTVPYDSLYLFDSVRVGSVIYFTGGGDPQSDTTPERFYQTMRSVTIQEDMNAVVQELPKMNTARANHAMCAAGEKSLYVVGGTNSTGNIASCEEYSIAEKKWREVAPLNEKKRWVSLCAFKNKCLYAFGGVLDTGKIASDLIECLDFAKATAKTWEIVKLTAGKELVHKGFFMASVPLSDNSILIFGGIENEEEKNNCISFNPTKGVIEPRSATICPESFYRTKAGIRGGILTIVGSSNGDIHYYCIKENKWDCLLRNIWNPEVPGYHADTY